MYWKNQKLRTFGEVFTAALKVKDREEAERFLDAYVRSGVTREVALANLGYMAGYYSDEEAAFIRKMFGAKHPIFG